MGEEINAALTMTPSMEEHSCPSSIPAMVHPSPHSLLTGDAGSLITSSSCMSSFPTYKSQALVGMDTTGCSHLFPSTSLRKDAPKKSTGWLTHFISRVHLCWNIPQGHFCLLATPGKSQPGEDCLGSRKKQWQILPVNKIKSASSSCLEDTSPQLVDAEVSSSDLYFNKPRSLEKLLPRSSKLLVGGKNPCVGEY